MFDYIYLMYEGVKDFMDIGAPQSNSNTSTKIKGPRIDIPVDIGYEAFRRGISIIVTSEYEVGKIEGNNIFINPIHSLVRTRFIIAHCIGHHINGTIHGDPEQLQNFSASIGGEDGEANKRAMELLMPARAVITMRHSGASITEMANKFQVSEVAMDNRITSLMINRKS